MSYCAQDRKRYEERCCCDLHGATCSIEPASQRFAVTSKADIGRAVARLALLALDPTTRCIRLAEITSARLHRGILNDRLALTTRDGTRCRLLWLHVDPAYDVLASELPERLGTACRAG